MFDLNESILMLEAEQREVVEQLVRSFLVNKEEKSPQRLLAESLYPSLKNAPVRVFTNAPDYDPVKFQQLLLDSPTWPEEEIVEWENAIREMEINNHIEEW